jgi:phosphatidylinositol alpha-1,6-mannosyltransferase
LPRPLSGKFAAARSLAAVSRLRTILDTCDVVHNIVEPYGPVVAASCRRVMPFVQSAHGKWAVQPFLSLLRRRFYMTALKRVDLLVFQSAFTRAEMALVVELPRHEVWPAGVDPAMFETNDHVSLPGWASAGPVVLSVGALKERKGHHLALEAVAQAMASQSSLHFVVIGEGRAGAYADRLRAQAARLEISDHVHLLGRVPEAELRAWYRRADVFLSLPVHRKGSFEGLGLVYLEAGAAGKACVAAAGAGVDEAVVDGETGFLVPQGDVDSAGRALARLLADRDLRRRMGGTARHRVRSMSWARLAERLVSAYKALAGDGGLLPRADSGCP